MWRNNKVLVIDDNQSRRHDLKILFDFLSETALTTASDTWQATVAEENNGEDYVAILIGDYRDSNQTLAQLLKEIRSWNDELAIVLIGDENHNADEGLDDLYRFMIIA
ncbi:MAG: fleQ, partial [Cellvibrio sp.]|nr:fleQ [Cellvibrio sp.]